VLILALLVLWVTAAQWDGPFRPAPPPSQSFVYLNDTAWSFHGTPSCWQEPLVSVGGTVLFGGTFHASVDLSYPGGVSGPTCSAQSVVVLTSGFTLLGSNAPIAVAPGGDGHLEVNVTVPTTEYSGALAISVAVVAA
jgi:hypothetical protein